LRVCHHAWSAWRPADLPIVGGATGARVGNYLTDNIYTEVMVSSDGSGEIDLNLTLSPSLTARGNVTSKAENSLGLFFERDYCGGHGLI
jgi:autotransporter translocation and assembly factor TamB